MTLEQLAAVMKNCQAAKLAACHPRLLAAMKEFGVDTPARRAAFLAQLAHESGEFRWMEEIASGAAYEGREDLGNVFPGDGVRFKGRGAIQLTGRLNYARAAEALKVDLVSKPELAASPEHAFRIAAWFWKDRGLNSLADLGTATAFEKITRYVNGVSLVAIRKDPKAGHHDRRCAYHVLAKKALGC